METEIILSGSLMRRGKGDLLKKEEAFSSISHFLGFILSIGGTFLLLEKGMGDISKIIVSLIYGLSTSFLFLASSLYHFFKKQENENSFWRRLDHTAIFFMIAGTYTPVCYLRLPGYWKWGIIITQWALVFGGIFFKFFYLNAPRYFSTTIYIVMGWVAIIVIKQLFIYMQEIELIFLILGGISYTIGAIFYAIKKPNLSSGFGFHEIFHIFILLGALFHYLMIYSLIEHS